MFKKKGIMAGDSSNTVVVKCRLYDYDTILLNKHFGCSRFVYNEALSLNKELYKKEKRSLSYVELQNRLPEFKQKEETSFLKEVDATSLQQAIQDYSQSLKMFIMRKGGYPSFRKKYLNDTFRIINIKSNNSCSIRFDGGKLKLGKFGWVKTKPNMIIPDGEIQSATVKRTKTGKVFATVCIRRSDKIKQFDKTGKETAIDLGIKNYITLLNGDTVERPLFIKRYEKQLDAMERSLSRKQHNSKNYIKAKKKLAFICEKETNRLMDFQHKLSLSIVRDYDFIAVEHLNVKAMLKDNKIPNKKKVHRLISELGWYRFISMLEYKSKRYGKEFVKVNTYYPSSQTCSHCGYKNMETKNLSVRKWVCPQCGAEHDRDINACYNIYNEGKRILSEKQ